jgi:hypothetical protein
MCETERERSKSHTVSQIDPRLSGIVSARLGMTTTGSGSSNTTVPEPATILLFVL